MKRLLLLLALPVCALAQNNISGQAVVLYQSNPAGLSCVSTSPLILYNSQIYSCQSGAYALYTTSGGSGTVTSVGGLAPLFSVANPTTAAVFSLSNAAAATFFGNGTASPAAPGFTAFSTLADGTTITFTGGQFHSTAAGSGTVTSVALTLPAIFSVGGSPVTTAGTIAATLASQTANTFFAAPNGSPGAPVFRAIVAADIPTLNQSTTGNAATATALAAVPTLCSTGFAPTGVLASGNATGCAAIGGGGGGTPGGSTGQMQYNNAGAFGGLSTSGVLKLTSGVASAAGFADVVALFGGGSCAGYLKNDGTCSTSSGGITVVNSAGTSLGTASSLQFGQPTDPSNFTLTSLGAGAFRVDPVLDPSTVTYNGSGSYTAGQKQTFAASSTTAGVGYGGVTVDPSSTTAGDFWWRTDTKRLSSYDGAATQRVAWLSDITGTGPTTNQNIRDLSITFTAGASALSGSTTACSAIPYSGTIQKAYLIGDTTGSATVDVKTIAVGSYTGSGSGTSITASAIPALSAATVYTDATLTGWTTSLAADTVVCGVLSSPSSVHSVTLTLKVAAN